MRGLSALVLGGGSGLGRAAALAYSAAGASVTVLERSAELGTALQDADASMTVLVGDATNPATVKEAVASARSSDGQLDHLTCCVGVFDHYLSLRDITADQLILAAEEMWRTNVLSTVMAVNLAHESLRAAKGSITLTLSESAFAAVGGGVLYGSSKWALRGAVHHLSADLAPDVRVNGVAPGGTSGTAFAGMSSLGQDGSLVSDDQERDARIARGNLLHLTPTPEDHASAYLYLADPVAARVVTGLVVRTDGGGARKC